jgi:hypothetical protein
MNIIHVLVVLIVIGVVLYLVNTYIPMAQPVKTILNVVVVLLLVLWLLSAFFGLSSFYVGPRRP